jgi:uncharacterized protein (DUF1684 family)
MEPDYKNELETWRRQTDENLRREKSWLALTGLYWLHEGENAFGSDPENEVPFPPGIGEAHVGDFKLNGEQVFIEVNPGMQVQVGGEAVSSMPIKPDVSGEPDDIDCGRIAMRLVRRGDRFGIRMWYRDHPRRVGFPGRQWFAADANYVVPAVFHEYAPPKEIPITNILGDTEAEQMAGWVEFEFAGRTARLEAIGTTSEELFLIFKDSTSGKSTYPAGRYLYTEPPQDGRVLLDFNRAYNPPCAFTEFATCPLPPKENHLTFAIEAGERMPE